MSEIFNCKDCGHSVSWRTTKEGKKYLGRPRDWSGTEGGNRTYWPSHKCVPNPDWKAARELHLLEETARRWGSGGIAKGVWVDVVKGRKVPVGIRAEVVWIGDSAYGARVGIMVDGERVFTALTNVQPAPIEDFPEMVEILQKIKDDYRKELEGVN